MRKSTLFAFLFLLTWITSYAQHDPMYWDPHYFNGTTGYYFVTNTPAVSGYGLHPADSVLPPLPAWSYNYDTLRFTSTGTASAGTIDSMTIDSIYLPAGYSFLCSKRNKTWIRTETGTIWIQGSNVAPPGQYKLRIIADFYTSFGRLRNVDLEQFAGVRYYLRIPCAANAAPAINRQDTTSAYQPYVICDTTLHVNIHGRNHICPTADTASLAVPTGNGWRYRWSTGDTTNSIYTWIPGTYTVTIYRGADSAVSAPFTLSYPANTAHAAFQVVPDPNAPHSWIAVNQSTGNNLTYRWSWGDNQYSTGPTPSHTYDSAGNYLICLFAQDSFYCYSTVCDSANVYKTDAQMVTIHVIQYALGMTDVRGEQRMVNMSYYAGAVHFSEEIVDPAEITVSDLSGKVVVRKKDWQGVQLPLDGALSDGIYILTFQNSKGLLSGRIGIVR